MSESPCGDRVCSNLGCTDDCGLPAGSSVPEAARAAEMDTGWGCTFHRHFASNAIHRDGYVEDCDQPGSHRVVYAAMKSFWRRLLCDLGWHDMRGMGLPGGSTIIFRCRHCGAR